MRAIFSTCFLIAFLTFSSRAQHSSETVITAEEIRERGYDNLDELLSSVQGLYLTHDRNLTQIGVRGLSPEGGNNQRVQVLVDDIPLNNPLSGQALAGYDLRGIDMEDIETVTVIRSPSPVLHGNNAMLGVIKIATKKSQKGLRLHFDTGSYGELDGGLSLGRSIGKTEIGLMGRLARIKGPEIYLPEDITLDREEENFAGIGIRVKRGKFSFQAFYNQREETLAGVPSTRNLIPVDISLYRIIPYPVVGTPMFFKESTDMPGVFSQSNFFSDISYSGQAGEIRFFLNFAGQDQLLSFQDTEEDDLFASTVAYDEAQLQRAWWTGLSYKRAIRLGNRNQMQVGADLVVAPMLEFDSHAGAVSQSFAEAGFFYDTITTGFDNALLYYLESKQITFFEYFAYSAISIYAFDHFQASEKLAFSGGARVDVNSQSRPVLAPEFNILYTPFEEKTSLRLGYSRGYRLPGVLETAVALPGQPLPNGDLFAERVNSFELGWVQHINEGLDLNAALFHRRLGDSTLQATGLDAGLTVGLAQGVRSYFNYNFQFTNRGKVNMPSPLCKFGVAIPFLKHFTFFTEGQYEGARLTFAGTQTLPFFLMNANLLIRPQAAASNSLAGVLNAMSFSFRVYNMWDEFYQHPAEGLYRPQLTPQNGRTWQAQWTLEF